MLGYIVPEKGELKVREYEVYSAYYCGICKSVGRRYGQFPRFTLSYDFVFLAVLLGSLADEKDEISKEHCIIHHIKKRPVAAASQAMEYAGDVMLILAYYKLMDDYYDDGDLKAKAMAVGLKSTIKKLQTVRPELCRVVEGNLQALSKLEKEKCPEIDRAEEPFAQIMAEIFEKGIPQTKENQNSAKILKQIGYHLGKWIYLMDAYEDIQENITKKTYNPLIFRFEYGQTNESVEEFKARIKPTVEFNLIHYLAQMSSAVDLLDMKKNKGIVENIAYFGLRRRTERVLDIIDKKESDKE